MTLAITGWSVLTSAGIGREPFARALHSGAAASPPPPVADLYPDPLPSANGHALRGVNARDLLGRKGTGSLDRRTTLALVACRDALADAGVTVTDGTRHRVGVALGTTWGSFQAMSDYTKDTFVQERPYFVEPARFPNTVMNCAAGQAAIWFGLRGVNATVAGGPIAFLNTLEYAANVLRCGYADTILAGGVEEFTPHAAWATYLMRDAVPDQAAGEAAAVFVVERADDAAAANRNIVGQVLAVATRFAPGGVAGGAAVTALERCVRLVLDRAQLQPTDVSVVATIGAANDDRGRVEGDAVARVLGESRPMRIVPKAFFGDCHAALGALQLAAIFTRPPAADAASGRYALLTACTGEGAVGAAVVQA
jgi:3-oxoacyl-[acyl-carrier-protein] synthase II